MPRVLIPPSAVCGRSITVSDPRALHHLRDVLRLRVGDRLECFDGSGATYAGPIRRCTRQSLVVEIRERFREPAYPVSLTLAQALIKPERFEWLIEKATELGVETVIPLITERTVVRPAPDRVEPRVTRWQRIANEAATQCGRITLPRIEVPCSFRDFMPSVEGYARRLMPTLAVPATPLKDELETSTEAVPTIVLIGPEGDFTREEVAVAQRHGVHPVSLGRLTLRSETAAIAVLSQLYVRGQTPFGVHVRGQTPFGV